MTPELWTAEHLGTPVVLVPAAGAHGRVQTWLVRSEDNTLLGVLRWGLATRKFVQERAVAEQVWPRLSGAPALLKTGATHGALLRTAVPGVAGSTGPAAVAAAARVVADLHRLPVVDADPVSVAEAVGLRAAAAGRELAGEPRAEEALRVVDGGRLFSQVRRCWCHRDLQPDNWIWDGHRLGLVDWEHSRPDAPELDLAHLVPTAAWPVFRQHYGPVDEGRLRAAVALHGLVTLAWGRRHADAVFVQRGRDALATSLSGSFS